MNEVLIDQAMRWKHPKICYCPGRFIVLAYLSLSVDRQVDSQASTQAGMPRRGKMFIEKMAPK